MLERGTILVVDDEQPTCELLQEILGAEGYQVLTASNGREGSALFHQHATEIRAVLLDLWMPGMSGRVVCEEIYRTHPGARVIFVTALDQPLTQAVLAGLPIAGAASKPFDRAELLGKVREVVGG
ncbi:MAG TPA: response regulator [Candidatus Acidoferrum sp.]|nr:response regulator [Candidatus Acidoferrum sp.]